jgi:hypothetical protein
MNMTQQLLSMLPFQLPFLLLYMVGIGLAVVNLQRIPRPAKFALAGFALFFLQAITSTVINAYIYNDITSMSSWILPNAIASTALSFFATLLIIFAIFTRSQPSHESDASNSLIQASNMNGQLRPHSAITVLVLGILSLVVFPPIGPIAWFIGKNDLKSMRAGEIDRSGEGMTSVGMALGIVGTVFLVIGIAGLCLWLMALALG